MNIQDLDEFLHIDTSGERWHLKHPGELSPFYANLPLHNYHNMQCYCFDFANTLKTERIGVVKESRYTTIPPHYHKDMELNYIYEGTCTFIINGKEVTMTQGDLCILDTNVIHSATSYKSAHDIVINIVFKKEFFNSVFLSRLSQKGIITTFLLNAISKNRQHNQYIIFNTQNNFKLHTLIQFLLCEYFGPSRCFNELMQTYVSAIFLELINTLYDSQDTNYNDKMSQETLIPILNYIEENYTHCKLEDVSKKFGYNPNYLSNLLKKKTGMSFIEIKTAQQLTEGAFLLTNSQLTINEIVYKVGCNNINYFYKKFHAMYGMTPKEYRNTANELTHSF
ncbi:AraC family transcriptional regulator [Candidatus Stoquefichus sp. SB1]|uniref:AraC family transcriptional regulator n=1 Tax=Candidatus Stoquefichus sp. SB1 TaxID=1658109 RepID=UPI00067E8A50|nr:AraC family transcriptional regulator [Candidatus Stoquefichus sp. SB1]